MSINTVISNYLNIHILIYSNYLNVACPLLNTKILRVLTPKIITRGKQAENNMTQTLPTKKLEETPALNLRKLKLKFVYYKL